MGERFAVVMAGGSGTRFWPASRAARPKQFLQLGGSAESLLQATVRRASAIVGQDHVLVVGSERHADLIREQLPTLTSRNVLLEPAPRNTAPCIAWAAAHVRRRDPAGVMVVLPADAHIADAAAFGSALQRALEAAETGAIVTLGARPTRPETGYGYLEVGELLMPSLHRVHAFVEKPDRERAERYFAGGQHLWNCGIFCFRCDVILREIERQLPELAAFVRECDAAQDERLVVSARYAQLPRVSIDYGVMEKAQEIAVVPASFGWNDVGSWAAAYELAHKDDSGNATTGQVLALDAHGCYVGGSPDKTIVLVGTQDLVVVDTEDALLVMPRARAQDVSKVVEALRKDGKEPVL